MRPQLDKQCHARFAARQKEDMFCVRQMRDLPKESVRGQQDLLRMGIFRIEAMKGVSNLGFQRSRIRLESYRLE